MAGGGSHGRHSPRHDMMRTLIHLLPPAAGTFCLYVLSRQPLHMLGRRWVLAAVT